jgi:hypothetical protein
LVEYDPSVYVVVTVPDGLEIVTVIVSGTLPPDDPSPHPDKAMTASMLSTAHTIFFLIFASPFLLLARTE